ncbi:hypothetical protein BSPWISOXPB_4008 [uncultured Gammaproteobacteria bacterium]|nr:hypothetical protein BSPWISOXPB_4008 [uncultured Gammaproteobacteria bacterium]
MNTKPLISPITAPPVFLIGVLASHILNAALMLCKPFKRVLKNDSKAQGSCELIEILKVCFKSKATPAMVTNTSINDSSTCSAVLLTKCAISSKLLRELV